MHAVRASCAGRTTTKRPPSNRLRVYEGQMGPLLQYYQLSDKLQLRRCGRGSEKAWKTVRKVIDGMPKPRAAIGRV